MNTNEVIGIVILAAVPLIGGMIALITPIIKLNATITKLNVTMEHMVGENTDIKAQIKEHDKTIENHEMRLCLMEHEKKESRHHEQ